MRFFPEENSTIAALHVKSKFAKLCALYVPVPYVPIVLRGFVSDMPRALRTLVPHLPHALSALVPYVFSCLTCLVLYVLLCPTSLVSYVLSCLMCLVAHLSCSIGAPVLLLPHLLQVSLMSRNSCVLHMPLVLSNFCRSKVITLICISDINLLDP